VHAVVFKERRNENAGLQKPFQTFKIGWSEVEKLRAKFFRFINDIFPANTPFYNV